MTWPHRQGSGPMLAASFSRLDESDDAVSLGAADEELVGLVRTSDALHLQRDAGPYHSAILYPDEASLGAVLRQLSLRRRGRR